MINNEDQRLWRQFWKKHQRYSTLCLACTKHTKEKKQITEISSPVSAQHPDWEVEDLDAASRAILIRWYQSAKLAKRRPPDLEEDSSDGDEPDTSFSASPAELDDMSKAIGRLWLRVARQRRERRGQR
mmetsp:Transcript_53864/g.161163  ORF Transcript_53864/g.161163 Transcript_53864/m.161163 type:complete len:128 (+) Transcript_53864:198-581(+)